MTQQARKEEIEQVKFIQPILKEHHERLTSTLGFASSTHNRVSTALGPYNNRSDNIVIA